jgi:hypothetical protein
MPLDLVPFDGQSLLERLIGRGISNSRVAEPNYPPFSEFFAKDGSWSACIKLRGPLKLEGAWAIRGDQIYVQTRIPKIVDRHPRNVEIDKCRNILGAGPEDPIFIDAVYEIDLPPQKIECFVEPLRT